ncbi:unnamed protein product [Spodoptera littoralis]|uniref:UDP-glucuronosyltransferase n=1 Tax=Spodoptera littoralis TaxID=7109 RepID=A0A9P0N6M9_SPOLI|nr:unnamed protein product [Spodoptera littoralis]CAH1641750.1 unnamed protein product [Spodoptera littoralis]
MLSFVYIITCCAFLVNQSESARILAMFPVASISHQVVFRPLTQELARRGHEVTVITPDPAFPKDEAPANLTEIDVHDISYELWNSIFLDTRKDNKGNVIFAIKKIYEAITAIVDAQFQDERVRNIIDDKSKQFDLILVEAMVRPTLVLSHIFKAPLIQISSFGGVIDTYENMGASIHPFLYPSITRQRLHNLSLLEKINELYSYYQINRIYKNNEVNENKVLRKNFEDQVPTIAELKNNVDMLFININPIFEGIRPVPPSVIYMGGLHQKPNKDLPALQSYLDSSKTGVIYISFGSNVDPTLLPADRIEVLVKTLSQMPHDVLWKWNGDILPGRTDNIRIAKWLPQQDLLRHPKIKLFITQAGLQSTDEAISGGVPMIAFPMFADQPYNAEKYEFFKIGIKLNLDKVTVEQFTNAIKTVIEDKSYKKNVEKLRSVIYDQPQSPLERAVWWTEHVLRHGGARNLRGPAANMSWAEYLELELVFTLLLGLFVFLLTLVYFIRVIVKAIFSSIVSTPKVKKN